MTKHAKLSASGSATWLNCPASIKATEQIENKTNIYAEEGTFAHAMAELCLKSGNNASHYLTHRIPQSVYGETYSDFIYDREMSNYVQVYLDYVRSFNIPFKVEVRADYSKWVPEGFGTSDCIAYDESTKTLHVMDLKYGKGVRVSANDNTQGMLYALGSLSHYPKPDNVCIHIIQPRLDHIDTFDISYTDLMVFAKKASEQAENALSDNPTYNVGEKQCKWCRAKSTCKALANHTAETLLTKFGNLTTGDIETTEVDNLTDNQIRHILDNKALIEDFLKAIEAKVFEDLNSGKEFEGYKLVAGRSISKWVDTAESSLKELLNDEDKLYKKSLITITEAKKLLDKDVIASLTYKPEGKPTLAKSSDKRKSINILKFS